MITKRIAIFSRVIFIAIAIGLIGYVFIYNMAPFGINAHLSSTGENNRIIVSPLDRIKQENTPEGPTIKLVGDVIYFSTNMEYDFDTAKIKLIFKNSNNNQTLELGFQDLEIWHHYTESIDIPFLSDLVNAGWKITEQKPTIIQRNNKYSSIHDMLQNPPEKQVIGSINFDENIFRQTSIPSYTRSNKDTVIDTPLRGKVVFYTYLSNEPFKLNLWKQDLNWYAEPDVVTVKIYKEEDVVYTAQIEDDGIVDDSRKSYPPQEAYIENPGPEFPEPGVYKVVIETGGDSVITRMQTNLHKIVFLSPIFPVSNHDVYPQISKETIPNTIWTDALEISAITNHPQAIQEIKIGTSSAQLNLNEELVASSSTQITEIYLPKSDVQIKGNMGYFFFNNEQYFKPNRFNIQNITSKEDLEGVDYIITKFSPPKQEGEWKVSETEFDLRTAYVKDGKLSWIIKAPGLKENGNEVIIKSIEVELIKKPLINR